jgi:hypothetical protein
MLFAPFQLPLYRLADELAAAFAFLKGGVDALKRALREACRGLLVIDLFPTHILRIDDITNCYKPHFRRYHLLHLPGLLISSIHQQREPHMTSLTLGTAKITTRDGLIVVNWMNSGSFLVGEQLFGNHRTGATAAFRFCRERGLRVIEA